MTWVYLDLDGTLTDPYEGLANCVRHALEPWGIGQGDEELRGWVGPPLRDSFAALGLGNDEVEAAVRRFRERYFDVGWAENAPYPGIETALARLGAAGLRLGIATSKPTEPARRIVDHFGLGEHLEFVAGASLGAERDTKADVIAWARSEFGAGDGWMVGDRHHDVEGGRAWDLGTVGVTWGYGDRDELLEAGADHLVDTPADLADLLAP